MTSEYPIPRFPHARVGERFARQRFTRNVAVMRKGRRNTRVCTRRARNGPIYSEPARGYSRGWASISESNRNLLLVLEQPAVRRSMIAPITANLLMNFRIMAGPLR